MKRSLIVLALAGLTLGANSVLANDSTDVFADPFWKMAPEATVLVERNIAGDGRLYGPFDSYAQ
jgi:hypothetical protein